MVPAYLHWLVRTAQPGESLNICEHYIREWLQVLGRTVEEILSEGDEEILLLAVRCDLFAKEALALLRGGRLCSGEDETLVLAMQCEELAHEAFGELFRRYQAVMMLWFQRWGVSYHNAEDLIGEINAHLWVLLRRGGGFDRGRDRASYAAWLYRIAYYRFVDLWRKTKKTRRPLDLGKVPEPIAPDSGPDELAQLHELNGQLEQLLAMLPPHYREVLEATAKGEEPAQIAARLGVPVTVIYNRRFRSRALLRELLQELRGPSPRST